MILRINDTSSLYDVESLQINDCELFVIFKEDHRYKTIEEINSILSQVGIHIGNFYFKGVESYRYDPYMPDKIYKEEAYNETSILCVIPEYMRKTFYICASTSK